MIRLFLILALSFFSTSVLAQKTIVKPNMLRYSMDSITIGNFNKSLDALFSSINQGEINEELLTSNNTALTKSQLQKLVNYETKKDSTLVVFQNKQLINIYPISDNQYFISLIYINTGANTNPILHYMIDLIATKKKDTFTFTLPLDYFTRYWKSETIGNITYHYRQKINRERAQRFNRKNSLIANKLEVKAEKFDFYMCDDFQEINKLLGFQYSIFLNGIYRDGYGVEANMIFSVMNNEDFSHDIFHYYSGKINEHKNRNWITEEGVAYLWGNAYYTDKDGEVISHQRLVNELKAYLIMHPDTNLLELFTKDTNIFNHISPEVSVRSVISGVIAKQVEKEKGTQGMLKLINAGSKDRLKSYLKSTNRLIAINKGNFNLKVAGLIQRH